MKTYIAAAAVFLSVGPVMAADLAPRSVEPAAPIAAPSMLWTGFYVGLNGGYGFGKFNTKYAGTPDQSLKGGLVGGTIGYNYQFENNVVIGAEGDLAWADLKKTVRDGNWMTESGKVDAIGTARLRVGYAFDNFLPYVTGGLIGIDAEQGQKCQSGAGAGFCLNHTPYSLSESKTQFGWTIGAGAEYALTQNWSIKAEYLYGGLANRKYDLGTAVGAPVVGPATPNTNARVIAEGKQNINIIRAGVNYRF